MLEPEAQDLKLTVLVDNVVDIFQPSIGPWSYPVAGPASSLWGEQGLSLLVEATGSRGESVHVLYDFGRSGPVLNHNLKILRPDGAGADLLMLSHGHIDHYGGLGAYLNEGGRGAPLLTHPASFGSRGIRRPDGGMAGPWLFEKRSLLDWGLDVRTSTVAQQLGPGLWSTGSIPRLSSLDVHLDQAVRFDQEGRLLPDALEDDQALVALVAGLGLVVITGCCHAGAINTLDAAAAMFPGQPLYALIGGLHLNHLTEGPGPGRGPGDKGPRPPLGAAHALHRGHGHPDSAPDPGAALPSRRGGAHPGYQAGHQAGHQGRGKSMTRPLTVAITGASGVCYGVELLKALREISVPVHLIVSRAGARNLAIETDYSLEQVRAMAERWYEPEDVAAPLASGSFLTQGMIVAPCTIKTLSAIANSYTADLVVRAADVTLKERRPLVLMVRETPLQQGAPGPHGPGRRPGRGYPAPGARLLSPASHHKRHHPPERGQGPGSARPGTQSVHQVGRPRRLLRLNRKELDAPPARRR